jgi:signal peptidase II
MIFPIVFLCSITADQLVKTLLISFLPLSQPQPVIGHFLFLTLTWNTGAAFSFLPQAASFFLIFNLLAIAVPFGWYGRLIRQRPLFQIACGLITGGAFGNVLDRLQYGKVIDFIDVRFWPVFNLADSCIFVGAFLFALVLLWGGRKPFPN